MARPGVTHPVAFRPGVVGVQHVLVGAGDPCPPGDGRYDRGPAGNFGYAVDPAAEGGIDDGAGDVVFAEISGSAVADVASLGTILIPQMEKKGYPRPFAAAITSASASIAIIIPPSIPLIIYGALAEESVIKLFIAGPRAGGHHGRLPDGVYLRLRVTQRVAGRQPLPVSPPAAGVPTGDLGPWPSRSSSSAGSSAASSPRPRQRAGRGGRGASHRPLHHPADQPPRHAVHHPRGGQADQHRAPHGVHLGGARVVPHERGHPPADRGAGDADLRQPLRADVRHQHHAHLPRDVPAPGSPG